MNLKVGRSVRLTWFNFVEESYTGDITNVTDDSVTIRWNGGACSTQIVPRESFEAWFGTGVSFKMEWDETSIVENILKRYEV